MYALRVADTVVAPAAPQATQTVIAGAANEAKCTAYAEAAGGTQAATVVIEGRPAGATQWAVLATITLSAGTPVDEAVDIPVMEEMRANVTSIAASVTLDAWLTIYDRQ